MEGKYCAHVETYFTVMLALAKNRRFALEPGQVRCLLKATTPICPPMYALQRGTEKKRKMTLEGNIGRKFALPSTKIKQA